MIPWITSRLADGTGEMQIPGTGSSIFGLTALLWDVERPQRAKDQLVLVEAPRSLVWYPYGDAMYLFRRSRRVGFASFAVNGNAISSVGFRYQDPMDPNSGTRKHSQLLTGWQGVAELVAAAVRRSREWKNLETIEVDHDGYTYYKLWATPRHDLRVVWPTTRDFDRGACAFKRNQPVQLASISVERHWEDDYLAEEVTNIQLYPDYYGYQQGGWGKYSSERWQQYVTDRELAQAAGAAIDAPMFLDLSDQFLERIKPHDGLELNINWES